MKNLAVLCIFLAFAADGLAQTPAPDRAPVQIAQAGGAASGATVPPATTGATSTVAAVIATGVAAVVAVTAYGSTSTAPSH